MERAAEFAEMSRAEFLNELARRRVDVFVVEEEDLARELRISASSSQRIAVVMSTTRVE